MAAKDIIDEYRNEKLNDDAYTQMACVSSSNAFTIETEYDLDSLSISTSDHTECTTPNAKRSESEVSQMLSNLILERWDLLFPPTPKETIESILGEDSHESSAGEAEREVAHHKTSSHVEDVELQNHITRNTAPAYSNKKKKPKKLEERQPYYHYAMPDTRILSGGVTTITAATMVGEYEELWKEIQKLILSECARLGL